jgi:hypothetical protein
VEERLPLPGGRLLPLPDLRALPLFAILVGVSLRDFTSVFVRRRLSP